MSGVDVAIKRLAHAKDLPLPQAATPLSAGVDLMAAIDAAIELQPGEKIGLRIKCADNDKPEHTLQAIALGHLSQSKASKVTIHHSREYPSNLVLPITKGNRIGTYYSGGILPKP